MQLDTFFSSRLARDIGAVVLQLCGHSLTEEEKWFLSKGNFESVEERKALIALGKRALKGSENPDQKFSAASKQELTKLDKLLKQLEEQDREMELNRQLINRTDASHSGRGNIFEANRIRAANFLLGN
ncbi:MAG: hypothetical protein NZT61_05790 [Deltaproteobacteria bacterium]|nr:hypothetical protein [Deltaproteobacteria bacterium]